MAERRFRRTSGARRNSADRASGAGAAHLAGIFAAVVRAIAAIFAIILVVHIVLTLGNANPDNSITKLIGDLARPLALGFKGLFTPDNPKTMVLVNYGLAALFWLVLGALIAWVIRRVVR